LLFLKEFLLIPLFRKGKRKVKYYCWYKCVGEVPTVVFDLLSYYILFVFRFGGLFVALSESIVGDSFLQTNTKGRGFTAGGTR
jgi:hypothetical protein